MGGVLSHQPFRSPGGLRSSLFQLLIDLSPYPLPWAPLLYPATPPCKDPARTPAIPCKGPCIDPAKDPCKDAAKTLLCSATPCKRPCDALQWSCNPYQPSGRRSFREFYIPWAPSRCPPQVSGRPPGGSKRGPRRLQVGLKRGPRAQESQREPQEGPTRVTNKLLT